MRNLIRALAKILLENRGERKVKIYVMWWGPSLWAGALWIVNFYVQRARFYQNFTPCAAVFSAAFLTSKKRQNFLLSDLAHIKKHF